MFAYEGMKDDDRTREKLARNKHLIVAVFIPSCLISSNVARNGRSYKIVSFFIRNKHKTE